MTFESEGLLIVAIYTWLPPASYVVFSDNSGFYFLTQDRRVTADSSRNCATMIEENPKICADNFDFMFNVCPKTCGYSYNTGD